MPLNTVLSLRFTAGLDALVQCMRTTVRTCFEIRLLARALPHFFADMKQTRSSNLNQDTLFSKNFFLKQNSTITSEYENTRSPKEKKRMIRTE